MYQKTCSLQDAEGQQAAPCHAPLPGKSQAMPSYQIPHCSMRLLPFCTEVTLFLNLACSETVL